MTPQRLISDCRLQGVSVYLDGGKIKLRGDPDAVRVAADRLRPFKAAIMQYQMGLMSASVSDQVREFMEVDGMTLAEAQATAALSVQVFQPAEWLAMIGELDALIERYCTAAGLSGDAKTAITATRGKQSLASIPESLAWFWREVARLNRPKPAPAPVAQKKPDGYTSTRSAKLQMNWPGPTAPMQPISKEPQ